MRTRALNLDLDGPTKKKWRSPFHDWPRPACKRSIFERALRKVWLFRWDRHAKSFAATGISYCQSVEYRDEKIARYFPIRNWLAEELPRLHWPLQRRLRDLYWSIRHRIPGQYWHHTLHLGLKPGYYDADMKILHSVFEVVRWYVEVQLAGHQSEGDQYPWYGRRSPEAGLAHLDWEIEECSGGTQGGQLGQGEAAQIKKDVYLWWTVDRPNRIDPHDIYDIVAPERHKRRKKKRIGIWSMMNNRSANETRAMWGSMGLEEFYKKEDQEMLTKAVSILHHWWD